jgi:hypothetical protein
MRDGLYSMLRKYPVDVVRESIWDLCDEKRSKLLVARALYSIPRSEIVIWKNDLYNAAGSGAKEFCKTKFVRTSPFPPQLWFLEKGFLVETEKDKDQFCRFFQVERSSHVQGFLAWHAAGVSSVNGAVKGFQEGFIPAEQFTGREGITFGVVFARIFPDGKSIPMFRFLPAIFDGDEVYAAYASFIARMKFMEIELVSKQAVKLSRGYRRRLQREQRPLPNISTISLRRYAQDSSGKSSGLKDWQCSWFVKGHWRKQWYPSKDEHQVIYIEPFVKGPKDKPLRPPHESLYVVNR